MSRFHGARVAVSERLERRRLMSVAVSGYNPATSIQPLLDALVVPGTGLTVNAGASSYVGSNAQGGTYSGLSAGSGATALHLPDGIILSSGLANSALPGAMGDQGWNAAGDTNLTTLAGMSTHDANSITLSFTTAPGTNSVSFDFVYGSYDGTLDGFGAFLDGTSVTFNASGHAISRDSTYVKFNPYTSVVGFPELTVALRTVAPLDPNVTTHTLKLVAADCGDDIVDSGVFLANLRGSTATIGAASTAAVPTAGSFQLHQSAVTTDTTQPGVAITIDRVNGNAGAASVDFATSDGTALAGTDYTDTHGTVNFADGQNSATVYVPVLENATGASSSTFTLTLSNATGGAQLASPLSETVTIDNSLSVVNLDVNAYSVGETDGVVTISVTRTGNLVGTGSVAYSTVDGTALAGTNFVGTDGVLSFDAGQSTASFTVPVKQDMKVDPELDFDVVLSNPSGNVRVGAADDATVTIEDVTPPPTVSGILLTPPDQRRASTGAVGSTLQLSFDQTLAAAPTGDDIGLYRRFNERPGGKTSTRRVAVAVNSYDTETNTLTLKPRRTLRANRFYQLVVNGSAAQGESGALLDGTGTGTEDTPYSYTFGSGKHLSYVDRDGNRVTLDLHGPGKMSLTRDVNGQGQTLTLTGVTAATVLTGQVRATKMGGSGVTTLTNISGLGPATNALPAAMFVMA